jgi:hypothetical protein
VRWSQNFGATGFHDITPLGSELKQMLSSTRTLFTKDKSLTDKPSFTLLTQID